MGVVIQMPVPPKTESFKVGAHDVTLTYFPNAAAHERWKWAVRFVQVRYYFGYEPSIEAARREARGQINTLDRREKERM